MFGRTAAALGAGTYAGGVTASLLVLVALETGVTPTATAAVAVALATLVAAGVRFGVAPRRLERCRRYRVGTVPLALPVASGGAVLAIGLSGTPAAVEPGFAGALVAFVGYAVLASVAKTLHARRSVREGRRLASLPEVSDRTPSRRLRALNAVFGALLFGGALVGLLRGESGWSVYLLVSLGPLAVATETERSVTVTDRGLLFESRFGAKLLEWSTLEGYYRGTNLVVLRSEWWRDHLEFEGSAVDDAVDALDRYLPQTETPVVPAGGVRSNGPETSRTPEGKPE